MALSPDIVIFDETWNDVQFYSPLKPRLNNLDSYQETNVFLYPSNFADDYLAEHSELYLDLRYLYNDVYFRTEDQVRSKSKIPRGNDSAYGNQIIDGFDLQVYSNIQLFIEAAKIRGIKPLVIVQPTLISKKNTGIEKEKMDFSFVKLNYDGVLTAVTSIQNQIRKAAKANEAQIIDAALDLSGKNDIFHDHVHLNELGSKMFAQYCFEKLKPIVLEQIKIKSKKNSKN